MAYTQVTISDDKASCPICFESNKQSSFLQCTHSFCDQCLQTLTKRSEGTTFKCPLCRQEYDVITLAPTKNQDQPSNYTAEIFFSDQGNIRTISQRVQNVEDRLLVNMDSRSNNNPRIIQTRESNIYSENACRNCISFGSFSVYMFHLFVVAIARTVIGVLLCIILEGDGVAIFQILKGVTDVLMAILHLNKFDKKFCVLVLTLVSIIVLTSGTFFTWSGMFAGSFIAWYTIVDWLMMIYPIVISITFIKEMCPCRGY